MFNPWFLVQSSLKEHTITFFGCLRFSWPRRETGGTRACEEGMPGSSKGDPSGRCCFTRSLPCFFFHREKIHWLVWFMVDRIHVCWWVITPIAMGCRCRWYVYIYIYRVGGFKLYPSDKYDIVNWDDQIPNHMEKYNMFQTTNQKFVGLVWQMEVGLVNM